MAFHHWPSFKAEDIMKFLDENGQVSRQEAYQYWSSCATRQRQVLFLVMFLYVFHGLKNTYIQFKLFQLFDYSSSNENLRLDIVEAVERKFEQNKTEHIYSFACLATNCIRLANSKESEIATLGEDVGNLPLLKICYPSIESYFLSIIGLGGTGILLNSVASLNVLLLGIILPLQQLISSAQSFLIMFIVAPKLIRQIMRARARELAIDVAVSLNNFGWNCSHRYSNDDNTTMDTNRGLIISDLGRTQEAKRYHFIDTHKIRLASHSRLKNHQALNVLNLTEGNSLVLESIVLRQFHRIEMPTSAKDAFDSDELMDSILRQKSHQEMTRLHFERLVDQCMPIIRTDWWRKRLARNFFSSVICFIFVMFLLGGSALLLIQNRLDSTKTLLFEYAKNIRQSNCSIWYQDHSISSNGKSQSDFLEQLYGLVIAGIWCARSIPKYTFEPMIAILTSLALSNVLLLMGANFHANARKIHPLIWSVIARLANSDNVRVQHLRSLWTKQVQLLDNEGGLALTAFKVRITYVRIIQHMLWISTIFPLTLKQR